MVISQFFKKMIVNRIKNAKFEKEDTDNNEESQENGTTYYIDPTEEFKSYIIKLSEQHPDISRNEIYNQVIIEDLWDFSLNRPKALSTYHSFEFDAMKEDTDNNETKNLSEGCNMAENTEQKIEEKAVEVVTTTKPVPQVPTSDLSRKVKEFVDAAFPITLGFAGGIFAGMLIAKYAMTKINKSGNNNVR
jgi:hypothetical protein